MDKNDTGLERETNITINGITFTTKEAFARYREEHTFKLGDAVNVLVEEYSSTVVKPGFIVGISDFGQDRISLDLVYISGYGNLEYGSIFSDQVESKDSKIKGVAPINEFNDLKFALSNLISKLESDIDAARRNLDAKVDQLKRIRSFVKED